MLFGSVSQRAVLYADCAVRVGRCPANRSNLPDDKPVRILVGWDGSSDAALAVRAASNRRWPAGSEGRLVTGLDAHFQIVLLTTSTLPGAEQGVVQDERELLLQQARAASEELRASGLSVEDPVMRPGDPRRILLQEAETWRADCIFVGAKGLSRIERVLLGSVSSAVASRAECSVEVIRSRFPT